MNRIEHDRRGFSLMELMVVITILGILAVLVVKNVWPMIAESKIKTTRANITTLKDLVGMYRLKNNKLPDRLDVLIEPDPKNLNQPYLEDEAMPTDGWGNDFVYKRDGSSFEIVSLGADGVEGGEGEDADISSKKLKDA